MKCRQCGKECGRLSERAITKFYAMKHEVFDGELSYPPDLESDFCSIQCADTFRMRIRALKSQPKAR